MIPALEDTNLNGSVGCLQLIGRGPLIIRAWLGNSCQGDFDSDGLNYICSKFEVFGRSNAKIECLSSITKR